MTEYIDRTQEPDEAFEAVLARFAAAPTPPEVLQPDAAREAVQRVLNLHTRSWFRIGPETEPRHDGQTCAHCNQYWGTAGCPTVRAIKDVDLLGRPVQCDGTCHEAADGSDAVCARCNSGDYYQACDDCRFYMAADR